MGLESGKPSQPSSVARTVVKYLDQQGRPVAPEKAVKIMTLEYDDEGTVINTQVVFNPGKSPFDRE